jgi:predicted metalloprotease with PDZ domain
MAGSPKTNSMTLSVEPRLVPVVDRYLPHLIAHEFFHTWTAAVETPDELRWVGEGFTDYYAWLVSARLGLGTWEEFAATLGEEMRKCAANPRRGEMSLVEAGGEVFFSDRNAYDLVYDGGLLIAAWLDRAIRAQKRGKTLDDLMRAFNNDPRWTGASAAPVLRDFVAVAERFTDGTTAAALERLVTQPYGFDPVDAFGQLGVTIRNEVTPPRMDLRANLDGTRVIDIDRNGIAYRVGVRANDRFVKINGQSVGDAREVRTAWRSPRDERIRVTLERAGETIEIDQALPQVEQFVVPVDPWRAHR